MTNSARAGSSTAISPSFCRSKKIPRAGIFAAHGVLDRTFARINANY